MRLNVDLSKTKNIFLIVAFCLALLYYGRVILIPLTLGFIGSLILYPICKFIERLKVPRIPAISITLALTIGIIAGVVTFLSSRLYLLFNDIRAFENNMQSLIIKLKAIVFKKIPVTSEKIDEIYDKSTQEVIDTSSHFISSTLASSTIILTMLALVFIYIFLFLLYRNSFKRFILFHFPVEEHFRMEMLLMQIQKVAQNYFAGIFIVTLIMGTLNTLGLMFIGIDHPFLFGFIGALLTIIPYIGTFIGGLLPFLYALVNYDDIWIPLSVMFWYIIVQVLEGNLITPKIVGSRVSLNPLFAIIALIVGEVIWGIAGMVLFIPIFAMLKVVFDSVDVLKPYGALLSSDFPNERGTIFRKMNKKISRIFKANESETL